MCEIHILYSTCQDNNRNEGDCVNNAIKIINCEISCQGLFVIVHKIQNVIKVVSFGQLVHIYHFLILHH